MTEHEANNNLIWISDKLWKSLSDEQKKWVQTAADELNMKEPAMALNLEHQSAGKLKAMGVSIVWLRSLIKPPPGFGVAYIDWSQQEFGIAAALSGDVVMQDASKIKDLIVGVR